MAEEHFYMGIDLGTTNSSVHWGALNPVTKLIEPKELAFDQMISDGSIQRRVLLPSYIYFKQGDPNPIVGEYARTLGLQAQPSRVVRSVKSHMGQAEWRFDVDSRTFTSAQLAGFILRTLAAGIQATWGRPFQDVVITVPASFDSDMREDTMEAARLAGFKVTEKDGNGRNLLLDEPRAALYDLLNQQLSGRIPSAVIDFSTPKMVLVFDLGGGTLDVSLHRVAQSVDSTDINVEDLAISRYTQLGGDVFDRLLADELQRRFEERHKLKLDDLSPLDQRLVRFRLETQAEQAKQRLTTDIQLKITQGFENIPDTFAIDIQVPYVYDNKGLFMQLTKRDFERVIAPLLGYDLTIEDVSRFDTIDYSKADNIIYPILDVLRKAQKYEGRVPTVEAVVLNGGMTRVHAVRDRLQVFFGLRPLTVLDPELSVSRGAVIYHYQIHRGLRPKQILAESIGLEVYGSRVHHLIPAGTILPTKQVFKDLFEVPYDNATVIRLPLYRGERKKPEPPNKKITERRFVLSSPQPAGTPLTVEMSIDENKLIRFVASLENAPDEKVEVLIGADGGETKSNPSVLPQIASPSKKPTGASLDPQVLRKQMRKAASSWNVSAFKALEPGILNASNGEALLTLLLDEVDTMPRVGKERIMYLFGEMGQIYPTHPKMANVVQACLHQLSSKNLNNKTFTNSVARNAVVALGKLGSPTVESHLSNLLARPEVAPIRSDILFALGKCGRSKNALKHVAEFIESDRVGDRLAATWSIGKLGSRERAPVIPIVELLDLVTVLGQKANPGYELHVTVRKFAVYALGEIGDRRPELNHRDTVDVEHAAYIVGVLQRALNLATPAKTEAETEEERQLRRFASMALRMVNGESLSAEEEGTLMAVRAMLAIGTA